MLIYKVKGIDGKRKVIILKKNTCNVKVQEGEAIHVSK